jgi:probable F420-dependent oxidoreductase
LKETAKVPQRHSDSALTSVGRPSLTLSLPNYGHYLSHLSCRDLVDMAKVAEDAGVDRIMVADHVIMGPNVDAYPWGDFRLHADDPFYEPLTLLSAIASCTSRVRLATGILISPLRNPVVLAKTASTIDQVSDGRLDLGVGVGWQSEEYEACGLNFEDRWRLISESLECCNLLWGEQPVSFAGRDVSFSDVYCVPRPMQSNGVPFWLGGGTSPANLRRVAKWCRGWIPIPINGAKVADVVETLKAGVPLLHDAFRQEARDPLSLGVSVTVPLVKASIGLGADLAKSLAGAEFLVEAGATDVTVPLQAFCRDLDTMPDFMRALVDEFESYFPREGSNTWAGR